MLSAASHLLCVFWCLQAAATARAAPIPPDSVILFTMTQLNVIARQPGATTVTIYDLSNNNAVFDTVSLNAEGEMYERTSGVPNYIAVSSTKEVTLFTGRALATRNDWSGVFIADDSNEKVGRVLRGLLETHLFVFVPRGPGDNSTTSCERATRSSSFPSVATARCIVSGLAPLLCTRRRTSYCAPGSAWATWA